MSRNRWQDAFRVGQTVDAVFYMAHGTAWKRCFVARKTRGGLPVVESPGFPGYTLVIPRKSEIRAVEGSAS